MQAEVLKSSKKRIHDILDSKRVDRIGILDIDFEFYSEAPQRDNEKFFITSFNGPFQNMSSAIGLEDALVKFAHEPRHSLSDLVRQQERIFCEYSLLKAKGLRFDGVWIWEDIAYDKGLYFSPERYLSQLKPVHKDICSFFAEEGLKTFFHCDGNIEVLIPHLADIGVNAIHPVQEGCNTNLLTIKKDFAGILSFVGGVGLQRIDDRIETLQGYIGLLKEYGNYIFSFDGPLPEALDTEEYRKILSSIESFGAYQ